jgi:hypothetical protein
MEYICEYKNSIPSSLCKEIIQLFETQEDKYEGITVGGVNKNIKDTTDFLIPKNDERWKKIEIFLYKELSNKLNKYLNNFKKKEYNSDYRNYSCFNLKNLFIHSFMIQKYDKKRGKYTYHDDFHFDSKSSRVITFLWYLNTVEEGGHTVFWKNNKVQPEEGKLIFFPAFWCYPHTGKVPISSDKYIITGWFYINAY